MSSHLLIDVRAVQKNVDGISTWVPYVSAC